MSGQQHRNPEREPNILERCPSYTYMITLRAYKTTLESRLTNNEELTPRVLEDNTIVLAATGGTAQYPNRLGTPAGRGDVFIKALDMTTVNGFAGGAIGATSPSTEMKLSLIETGGAEFLSGLMAATASLNQRQKAETVPSDAEAPYLLTVEFMAQGASEEIREELKKRTKHFKVRVLKADFSLKATHIEYEVYFVPYGMYANADTSQVPNLTSAITITGGTIGEYLEAYFAELNSRAVELNTGATYEIRYLNSAATVFRDSALTSVGDGNDTTNLDSLPMQDFQNLSNYVPGNNDSSEPTAETKSSEAVQLAVDVINQAQQGTNRTITIPQDVSIQALISKLCLNSLYLKTAFSDPCNIPFEVPYIRVWTMVETPGLEQEKENNVIKKQYIFNVIGVTMPVTRLAARDKMEDAFNRIKRQTLRSYKYFFTGGNSSILNLDLRYDYLFNQAYVKSFQRLQNNTNATDSAVAGSGEVPEETCGNRESADVPTNTTNATVGSGTESALPTDYEGWADKIRNELPELFNEHVEKNNAKMMIDVVGDPDMLFETNFVRNQESLENAVNSWAASNEEFSTFEPWYISFEIGNAVSNSFANIRYGGYYEAIRVRSTFDSGKFVTQLEVVRHRGLDTKVSDDQATAPASIAERPIQTVELLSITGDSIRIRHGIATNGTTGEILPTDDRVTTSTEVSPGTNDPNPGSDATSNPPRAVFAAVAAVNNATRRLREFASTAGMTALSLGGELNTLISNVASASSSLLSGAVTSGTSLISGFVSGGLTDGFSSITNTIGTIETTANSATTVLNAFQLPGMPSIGKSAEQLSAEIAQKGTPPSIPLPGADSVLTPTQLKAAGTSLVSSLNESLNSGVSSITSTTATTLAGIVDTNITAVGIAAPGATEKGFGGVDLATIAGALSGAVNPVTIVAQVISQPELGSAPGSPGLPAANPQLALLASGLVSSTAGLSSLTPTAIDDLAKKLSLGALATGNKLPNAIPGVAQPVGLNELVPVITLSPITGQWAIG